MKTLLQFLNLRTIRIPVVIALLVTGFLLPGTSGQAQIYEPEGLNMPGAWNAWTNPPTNLALASSTQVTGGRVVRIATGTPRWQTSFSVAATGGDLTGGTYEWLFTSGSTSNYYQNKWSAVTIAMNTLQSYTKEGAANNSITLVNGKWYTMNFEDLGYVNTRAIFMETSAAPVNITAVSVPASVLPNTAAPVTVTVSAAPSAEEIIYLRYSVDAWATSVAVPVPVIGTSGTVNIPGQVTGTVVSYYSFSSTLAAVTADFDLVTIQLNNNGGTNFTYTVGTAAPAITFANLQYPDAGNITIGMEYNVFGQFYIAGQTGIPGPAMGVTAWVGFSTANTNPSTWTDWVPATYNAPAGNNDEYKANIGPAITGYGTYYYATRYKLNSDAYVYGGYSSTGGGFWDGTANVSGVLAVFTGIPEGEATRVVAYPNPTFGGLNLDLQSPATVRFSNAIGNVVLEKSFTGGVQQVDISAFRAGVYHLQIMSGNQTMHQTIVKQ
ncbi:MAG: T9SS type A sorting domain-containing protein [Bacteroidales bacterium]